MTALEHLPTDYTANLSELTPEQRLAIEVDRARWFEAWRMFMKWPPHQIRAWLADQTDSELRADMARRLNQIKDRTKGAK